MSANIDTDRDDDFYTFDVQELTGNGFSLRVQLGDVANGADYDLYLYRWNGAAFDQVDSSTNTGSATESACYDGTGGDDSASYGVEVRRVAGSSCDPYTLEIKDF